MITFKRLKQQAKYQDFIDMKLDRTKVIDSSQTIIWTDSKGQKRIDSVRLLLPWDSTQGEAMDVFNKAVQEANLVSPENKAVKGKAD